MVVLQADIYMKDPVYLVTNKTDARSPWDDNQDPRVYFSLSDYYWPFQVSSVNPTGIPYRYNASVNLQVRLLHLQMPPGCSGWLPVCVRAWQLNVHLCGKFCEQRAALF